LAIVSQKFGGGAGSHLLVNLREFSSDA